MNEGAAAGDVGGGEAMTQRVRQREGLKMSERHNNQPDQPEPKQKEIEKRPKREPEDNRVPPAFFKTFEELKRMIVAERKEGWPGMAKDTATEHVNINDN
jgi:adenine specific DNA methylase Mod